MPTPPRLPQRHAYCAVIDGKQVDLYALRNSNGWVGNAMPIAR